MGKIVRFFRKTSDNGYDEPNLRLTYNFVAYNDVRPHKCSQDHGVLDIYEHFHENDEEK